MVVCLPQELSPDAVRLDALRCLAPALDGNGGGLHPHPFRFLMEVDHDVAQTGFANRKRCVLRREALRSTSAGEKQSPVSALGHVHCIPPLPLPPKLLHQAYQMESIRRLAFLIDVMDM